MDNNNQEYLISSDLHLISTICCFGYKVERCDKSNPNQSLFYVKKDSELDQLMRDYFARKLSVEPLMLASQIKSLKSYLFHT